jgi:hypothetical protein
MKKIVILGLLLMFVSAFVLAQTYEIRANAPNATTVEVQLRCTSVAGLPTTGNYVVDLLVGLRWPNSAGINMTGLTGTYNMAKSGVETVNGIYEFQSYAAGNTPFNFPTDWVQNTWVTVMTVTVTGGTGTETVEICPDAFHVTTNRNFNIDLTDYKPAINGSAVLPVELTSFTGNAKGRAIELAWSTASEKNNHGFEIERRSNDSWQNVGFVEGAGTSTSVKNYSYRDVVSAAGNYAYRLKPLQHSRWMTTN